MQSINVLDLKNNLADCLRQVRQGKEIAIKERNRIIARIARTRIPVWTLEQYRRLGMSEVEMLRAYPTLRAEDLANAWAYARAHLTEINKDIRQNEAADEVL